MAVGCSVVVCRLCVCVYVSVRAETCYAKSIGSEVQTGKHNEKGAPHLGSTANKIMIAKNDNIFLYYLHF